MSAGFGLVAAVALPLAAFACSVMAQEACSPYPLLKQELAKSFAEQPVGTGLTQAGAVLQLWISPDGRTWTITQTQPNGVSCIMSSGSYWDSSAAPQPGTPS